MPAQIPFIHRQLPNSKTTRRKLKTMIRRKKRSRSQMERQKAQRKTKYFNQKTVWMITIPWSKVDRT